MHPKRWMRFRTRKLHLTYRSMSYFEAFSVLKTPQKRMSIISFSKYAHKKYTTSTQTQVFFTIVNAGIM